MSVSRECCVLSCRGLCVGLIVCREESDRVSRVLSGCDRETALTHYGLSRQEKNI